MMKRKIGFFISLFVFLVAAVLLVSGSSLLTISLSEEYALPSGTFITWFGMMALPMSILLGIKRLHSPENKLYKILRILVWLSLLLAFLWVPVSYLLAGNLSFSFSEKESFQGGQTAMRWFWRYAYLVVILPLVVFLSHGLISIFGGSNARE